MSLLFVILHEHSQYKFGLMKLNFYSDDELLRIIRTNDTKTCNDALKSLYATYYPMIKKFILANNGNETEASDIFQDTVISFYEQLKKDNFTLTCSVKTYLYSISRNLWLKRLNRLKRFDRSVEDLEEFIPIEEVDFSPYDDETNASLLSVIDKLDEKCKQILIYYYFDKIKMKDIKDKMNLGSEQSAKNKKYKCMKHLMELVKKNKNLSLNLIEEY